MNSQLANKKNLRAPPLRSFMDAEVKSLPCKKTINKSKEIKVRRIK